MKRLFSLVFFVSAFFTISCSQTSKADNTIDIDAQGPIIKFEETSHDFGTIELNGNGTYNFVFKNEGTEPLLLTNVQSSCGCTVPQWPKEAIAPGKTAEISVKYDTRRKGGFNKSVTVLSNASAQPTVLRIKGSVIDPAAAEAANQAAK